MLIFLVLILINMMWAVQFAAAKIATAQLGPITVTVIPLAMSVVMMAPFLAGRRHDSPAGRIVPGSLGGVIASFVALGTVGIVISQLLLTWGIVRSLASNAAVITLATPATTAVLAFFLLREKMTPLRWVSFALALAGVVMVSDIDWHSVSLFKGKYLVGNLLLFLSCWGASFYNTYAKKLLLVFTPLEVTVYSMAVSTVALLPFSLIFEPLPWSRWMSLGWSVWISLLGIAVFSLTLATVLFFVVIQKVDVTLATLSVYLSTIFGVLFAVITVHEKVTPQLAVGGILVFVSVFLVTYWEERQKRRAALVQAGISKLG